MTPTQIEVFLCFWTLLGFSADVANLYHAFADRAHVLRRRVNAGREFALLDEIRRALLNGAAQSVFVILSLIALVTPNRPTPERTPTQWVLLVLFLAVPVILALQAMLDVRARRRLQRQYAAMGTTP